MAWHQLDRFGCMQDRKHFNAINIGRHYSQGIADGLRSTEDGAPTIGNLTLQQYAKRRTFIEQRDGAIENVPLLSHVHAVEQAGYLGVDTES